MFNNNQFYPGYMPNYGLNPYNMMQRPEPQETSTIQTIQNTPQTNPSVQCYFVTDKNELQNLKTVPNTFYIGINRKSKEIYIRSWNNDGNIDFNTYSQVEGKEEVSDLKMVMNKLNAIEEKLNERNDTNVSSKYNNRPNAKRSDDGLVQSNDAR